VTNPSAIAREFMERGRSESCPVIDSHGHYGTYRGFYFPKPYADGMIETMDRCGVVYTVCSSHTALAEADRGNAEMAQVIKDHPGRFYGYRVVNPNHPKQVEEEVARFEDDPGFVGFKFHPSGHSYPITGKHYKPALEYAEEHRLVILSHTWGDSSHDSPKMLAEVAAAYPNVEFLMGHSGYGDWDGALAAAREHANVYLELTAAYEIGGLIERMVKEVGSEKVVFGTDLPWFDPHFAIGAVCFSRIGEDDRQNILRRNAERLFGRFVKA
jgi:predicted TIM-barrel fold metal-dependent hydrolase